MKAGLFETFIGKPLTDVVFPLFGSAASACEEGLDQYDSKTLVFRLIAAGAASRTKGAPDSKKAISIRVVWVSSDHKETAVLLDASIINTAATDAEGDG